MNKLKEQLREIHHKGYPAYKSLKGVYNFGNYTLSIDHVQGDPFASPSSLSLWIDAKYANFPEWSFDNEVAMTALADYLTRCFYHEIGKYTFKVKGSGKSGLITVTNCGQEVLKRTACEVTNNGIKVRFFVGFPANGRTVNAKDLEKILFEYLPVSVEKAFYYRNADKAKLKSWIELAKNQAFIRQELKQRHLVAFVADGAILPRESGISARPLKGAKLFQSPESLRISLDLPYGGTMTGMGIKEGITLIVGGGYHGKSTLLDAISLGVYNHILGDGREYVITEETALKLRSEDGRFIKDVDVSMFIKNLPNGKDTVHFSTDDASGSTSQAAGIVEGIEAGSKTFLLDEDTSATNFMVRDELMQRVISPDKEPITPFVARARQLFEKEGISTVLVAGSSGAFFDIADTIIWMDSYQAVDITKKAKEIAAQYTMPHHVVSKYHLSNDARIMTKDPDGVIKRRDYRTGAVKNSGRESLKVKTLGKDSFALGKQTVDLRYIEQIVDSEQTAALGLLLKYAVEHLIDGQKSLEEICYRLEEMIQKKGLSFLAEKGDISGGYAIPRQQEIFSCFNRYRRK